MVEQQAKTMEIHLEPKRNAEGGQTSRRGRDFAFDALFTYDALGRRLSKDAIGITCWLWNSNMPLHEWTPSQRRNEQGEIEEIYKSYQDNKPVNIKKCLNHQYSF